MLPGHRNSLGMSNAETSNPLPLVLPRPRCADPCAMVIFGATGDLARRKLVPALYNLARAGHLPDEFSVLGFARSASDDRNFREELRAGVQEFSRTGFEPRIWDRFAAGIAALRRRQSAVLPGYSAQRDGGHRRPIGRRRSRAGCDG
jgi:Glucose-6-phosphate dehydrogenase, NAD binding domain